MGGSRFVSLHDHGADRSLRLSDSAFAALERVDMTLLANPSGNDSKIMTHLPADDNLHEITTGRVSKIDVVRPCASTDEAGEVACRTRHITSPQKTEYCIGSTMSCHPHAY